MSAIPKLLYEGYIMINMQIRLTADMTWQTQALLTTFLTVLHVTMSVPGPWLCACWLADIAHRHT